MDIFVEWLLRFTRLAYIHQVSVLIGLFSSILTLHNISA